MKNREKIVPTTVIALAAVLLGACGKSNPTALQNDRQRLEAEQQAEADAAKANKVITTNNQKMFSRLNASGPGVSTPAQSTQATGTNSTANK